MESKECKNCIEKPSSLDKWWYTILTTIILIIIINPYSYNLSQKVLGKLIGTISKNGCPTKLGLTIHIILFTLIVRFVMG
jgi:hypothetical protein